MVSQQTLCQNNRKNNKCGVIVFRKSDNKFLIVKNKTSQYWGFPKGHQEDGETTIQSAIRELREEAGIEIVENDILYSIKKKSWYLYIVLLDNVYVKIDNNEICAFKWVDYKTFTNYNMSKGTAMFVFREAYPRARNYVQNKSHNDFQRDYQRDVQNRFQVYPQNIANLNIHQSIQQNNTSELQKMENIFTKIKV